MHDVIFGEDLKGLNHLTKVDEGFFLWEGPFFLHEFIESTPITEFIDKIKVVYCL